MLQQILTNVVLDGYLVVNVVFLEHPKSHFGDLGIR